MPQVEATTHMNINAQEPRIAGHTVDFTAPSVPTGVAPWERFVASVADSSSTPTNGDGAGDTNGDELSGDADYPSPPALVGAGSFGLSEVDARRAHLEARAERLADVSADGLAMSLSWAGIGVFDGALIPAGVDLGDIERIIAHFERNPRVLQSLNVGTPARTEEEAMSDQDRIRYIAEVLERRERIAPAIPDGWNARVGERQIGVEVQDEIPANGIMRMAIVIDERTSEGTVPHQIGHVDCDIDAGKTVVIAEVHRYVHDASDELKRTLKAVRKDMRQGRKLPPDPDVPHGPGVEEMMILAVRQMLIDVAVVGKAADIHLLRADETFSARPDNGSTEEIMIRALGRAYELPQAVRDRQPDSSIKKSAADRSNEGLSMIRRLVTVADQKRSWGELQDEGHAGARELGQALYSRIPDSIRAQLHMTTFEEFVQREELRGLPFRSALEYATIWTTDYRRTYHAYRRAFAGEPQSETYVGRLIHGEALNTIPHARQTFVKKL